jgi:hypothetical protein
VSTTPSTSEETLELSEGSELSEEIAQEPEPELKPDLESDLKELSKPVSMAASATPSPESDYEGELLDRDIAGMSLSNPNFFFSRMYERDPKLFLKQKDGKFKAYSRICPSNLRRQPVILTDKEKERIDKENPGSYDKAIKYGSNADNQYWYICPRFWCLKTNTSMTEADVKAGKCGGSSKIIPHNARKVPKDAFVFEFNAKAEHVGSNGEYLKHYPGFVKEGNHPDGLCLPCCFKSWDAPTQKKRRDICGIGEKLVKKALKSSTVDEYIKSIDKFPLTQHRWGYMPLSVQRFLHTNNAKCQTKAGNRIKPFTTCMLRKGVETNKLQSFIGVIADLYPIYREKGTKASETVPTIKEMKQIIIDAMSIDTFMTYFGGSLINMFARDDLSVDIKKYKRSRVYKQLDLSDSYNRTYLKRISGAYENFIDYLKDDNILIDHTFIWDIISKPNKDLFPLGLNLAIIEIPNNDVTDNVELLCPTNNYSNEVFSAKKPTFIIMKKNEFYEPLYLYRDEQTKVVVTKTYSSYNSHLLSNIRNILKVVKQSHKKCQPLNSMPKIYKFRKNIGLNDMIKRLRSIDYKIVKQVVNYNNQVIGVIAQYKSSTGYLPVEPSSIMSKYSYVFMDDDDLWTDLANTVAFLQDVNTKSDNKIPCKPKVKMLEDGLIVGVLTETNQFIPIERPEENIGRKGIAAGVDDLDEQTGLQYFDSDKIIANARGDEVDVERIKMTKRIKMEGNFYNAFRNTARILLNKYEHLDFRKELEDNIKIVSLTYLEKMRLIEKKLRTFMDAYVTFVDMKDDTIMSLNNVTTCLQNKGDTCTDNPICLQKINHDRDSRSSEHRHSGEKSDDVCALILPDKHLISGNDNEIIYFYRLADELIRYGRIRNFIFKPQVYLSIDKVDYDLTNNEVILLDTILSKDYFVDLEETYQNKYITHSVPEFTQPQISQAYESKFNLKDFMSELPDIDSESKSKSRSVSEPKTKTKAVTKIKTKTKTTRKIIPKLLGKKIKLRKKLKIKDKKK